VTIRNRRPRFIAADSTERKELKRLLDRRLEPGVEVLGREQDRHRLGVDPRDDVVGLSGQEGKEPVLALLLLPLAGPRPPVLSVRVTDDHSS